jgi:hypothetical protein
MVRMRFILNAIQPVYRGRRNVKWARVNEDASTHIDKRRQECFVLSVAADVFFSVLFKDAFNNRDYVALAIAE